MTSHPPRSHFTRRHLLGGAATVAAGALFAACGGGATDMPKTAPTATVAKVTPPAATPPASAAPSSVPVTLTSSPATATVVPTASATAVVTAPPSSTAPTGSAPVTNAASSAPSGTTLSVEAGDLIKDAAGHFTFTGPKGWVANPDPINPTVAQLSAENPRRGMRVSESAPTEGKSLQQFAKETLATLKTNTSFRTGTRELQPTTLGGEPAIIDDYVTAANGTLGYYVRVLCIRLNLLYSVNFMTEPQAAEGLQPVVQLVLDSWTFV